MSALPSPTPWGTPEHVCEIAPGLIHFTTPSHGGFWLDDAQLAYVSAEGRAFAAKWSHGMGDHWFEQDCAWAYVAEAHPESFTPKNRELAALIRADQREKVEG